MIGLHEPLLDAVRHNCHIADAQHAADYTLCTYLMKMRELYRWEQGYPLDRELDNHQVGEWVRQREAQWESLETQAFRKLPLDDEAMDPFANEVINTALLPQGLIYSSGLGKHSAAHFYLADLLEKKDYNGFTVLISGREWARDLVSPPAMTRGNVIYLRRESLTRLLWERVQEWRWNRCESPMGRALSFYGLDDDLESGLAALVDDQLQAVLLHEVGEVRVGTGIESSWQSLLLSVSGHKAELQLRAIRDNLADALSTLPALIDDGRPQLIHFYFATLDPMRKYLSPMLYQAYRKWDHNGDLQPLKACIEQGQDHWQGLMDAILEPSQPGPAAKISALIEDNLL
jgi:hypothetical protein